MHKKLKSLPNITEIMHRIKRKRGATQMEHGCYEYERGAHSSRKKKKKEKVKVFSRQIKNEKVKVIKCFQLTCSSKAQK